MEKMELIFEKSVKGRRGYRLPPCDVPQVSPEEVLPEEYLREELPLPEVSELEAVRHYTNLSQLNYAVDTTMVPLGSCTMKYNPRVNEEVASLPPFLSAHPLTPEGPAPPGAGLRPQRAPQGAGGLCGGLSPARGGSPGGTSRPPPGKGLSRGQG